MFRVQPNRCCHDDYGEGTERLFYLVSLGGHPVLPLMLPLFSQQAPCGVFYNANVTGLQF